MRKAIIADVTNPEDHSSGLPCRLQSSALDWRDVMYLGVIYGVQILTALNQSPIPILFLAQNIFALHYMSGCLLVITFGTHRRCAQTVTPRAPPTACPAWRFPAAWQPRQRKHMEQNNRFLQKEKVILWQWRPFPLRQRRRSSSSLASLSIWEIRSETSSSISKTSFSALSNPVATTTPENWCLSRFNRNPIQPTQAMRAC